MSADVVARDQLRAFVQRVERVEEDIKTLNDDKSDIYKEARAMGFDVKVLRKVVAKRKIDKDERDEQDAIFDMYWDALHGAGHVHVHTHARENIEEFPTSDGSPSVSSSLTTREAEESVVSNPEMDRATEGSFETGSEAAEKGREAVPAGPEGVDLNHAGAGESPAILPEQTAEQAGGEHEVATGSALRAGLAAPTSNTGEGAAKTALPAAGVVMEYVPPFPMKRLPFAHCFPDHSKAEYERLEKDIAVNRVREPIIRQGDIILDGWNRYTIARKYGFSYPVQEYTGSDVLLDVIEWQRASRNFTPAQEKKIAADLAKEVPRRAEDIMAAFGLAEALEVA